MAVSIAVTNVWEAGRVPTSQGEKQVWRFEFAVAGDRRLQFKIVITETGGQFLEAQHNATIEFKRFMREAAAAADSFNPA